MENDDLEVRTSIVGICSDGLPSKHILGYQTIILKAHESENQDLFNNAAQSWNHAFYWKGMKVKVPYDVSPFCGYDLLIC